MSDSRGPLRLRDVRRLLDGHLPRAACTASPDGVPHVFYMPHVEYVDDERIALPFRGWQQPSRDKVLETGRVAITLEDPGNGAGVVVQAAYERTDVAGPLFDRMRAKLDAVDAHAGMGGVFRLRGADVYRVLGLHAVPGRRESPTPPPRCDVAAGARRLSEAIADCTELPALLDALMGGLREHLRVEHAMLWTVEPSRARLVLLASGGYERSGIGGETAVGEGVAGIVARDGVPVRIGPMSPQSPFELAVRGSALAVGLDGMLTDGIRLPGLEAPRSQLAVPLRACGRVTGVLLVESEHDGFFGHDDEDALVLVCGQLASTLALLQHGDPDAVPADEAPADQAPAELPRPEPTTGAPVRLRRYAHDDSVFIDGEYLIRGVAGAIAWKLATEHAHSGRREFTNRELRRSPELRLPEVQDNLETRLLLLARRLAERGGPLRLERTGRGRWHFAATRPLCFDEIPRGGA